MSISSEHPFLPPEADRSPVRRLRGRLPSPVTVWTAGSGDSRAGLTVSSLLVADGEPGYVLGVLDPLSDLWDALRDSGAAVVNVLDWRHRQLADAFGYVAPAPGGPFRLGAWIETEWGPALADSGSWAGCLLADQPAAELGWGLLVRLQVVHAAFGEDRAPLVHRRGRYLTAAPEQPASR
jgi:flavin reductase (DIM6/NTAB) family NADH-FMN oxidoreductase RutF